MVILDVISSEQEGEEEKIPHFSSVCDDAGEN